jgi:hypothetical protein
MADTATLPPIGTIGRVHKHGHAGFDWNRDYKVVGYLQPQTVYDDLDGHQAKPPRLILESVERVKNGSHDPLTEGLDHPAEMTTVPASWFVPKGAK